MIRILCILLFSLFSTNSFCDSEVPPFPRTTTSDRGDAYFIMVPARKILGDDGIEKRIKPLGIAFRPLANGSSKELWRVTGWYSHAVLLANDGEYLIRLGNIPRGSAPSDKDIAVTFYKNGKELRSYSTNDLVKDKTKVIRTSSHYLWLDDGESYLGIDFENKFHIKTIDGIGYIFDLSTGDIIKP